VEEASAAAANCTGYRASIFQYEGDVEGEIPCYTLSASVDGGTLSVEVTKAGGIVLELNQSRSVTETKLSPQEGVQQAQAFLARCGYRDMVETYYCQSDGRLTVNFAWQQGEVLCYPDLCSVTVALDTGSILGYECTSYVSNHTQRELETPAITVDEARQMVSPRLEILRAQLALIPTDGEYEVLCWEFVCASETGQHYIVCINAETGAEQKILILLEDENGTLAI
jgi:germination protein YpeB